MHKLSGFLLLFVVVCLVKGKAVYERQNNGEISALRAVVEGNNKFSFELLKAIHNNEKDHLVASPLGVYAALGLLSQGAEGETKQQILKAAHLPTDDDVIRAGFKELLTPLHSKANNGLDLADAAFIEKTFPIKTSFENISQASFLADIESLDFSTNATHAASIMNQWALEHSDGKIRRIVDPRDVNSHTEFVLASALSFNGIWENGFNASLTKELPFHVKNRTDKKTLMMSTTAEFNYSYIEELDAEVLGLDYKGSEVRMVIVLPSEVNGLRKLVSKIHGFGQIKPDSPARKVEVTLPKFRVEDKLGYVPILKEFGIRDVFTTTANLSGISEKKELKISHVEQKSFIEVNEKGAVADDDSEHNGSQPLIPAFIADREFLYFLEHVPTNSVITFGIFRTP